MFRRSSFAFLMLLVLVLRAGPAFAQSASTPSGTVVDVSGLAVAGAQVIARTADGRATTTTAGADGTFPIDTGIVSLRVTAPGFAPTARPSA